jgi:ABC-type dipeptide/oligopeptide/nickel transport system permease subunit
VRAATAAAKRLAHDPLTLLSIATLALVALACFPGASLAARALGRDELDVQFRAMDVGLWTRVDGELYVLGTDLIGRDVFLRLLYGGRATLTIAVLATLGAAALGLACGVPAGRLARRRRSADLLLVLPLVAVAAITAVPSENRLDEFESGSLAAGTLDLVLYLAAFGGALLAVGVRQAVLADHPVLRPLLGFAFLALAANILLETGSGGSIHPPHPSWGSLALRSSFGVTFGELRLAVWPILAALLTASALVVVAARILAPRVEAPGRPLT